jgi:hypothetical protein
MVVEAEDYLMCMCDRENFVTCTDKGHLKVWSIDEEEEIADSDEIYEDSENTIISVVPFEDMIITFAENCKTIKKWGIHGLSLLAELDLSKAIEKGITTSINGNVLHLANDRNIYKIDLEDFEIIEEYSDRNTVTCMNSYSEGAKNIYVTRQINVQARENKIQQLWSQYFDGEKIEAVVSEQNNVLFILGKPENNKDCYITIYNLKNFFRYGKVTIKLPEKPQDF